MRTLTQRLRAFGAFWYDFVIGDDWRVAVVVVVALAATFGAEHATGRGVVDDARRPDRAASAQPLARGPKKH